jgi:hypothetical protein
MAHHKMRPLAAALAIVSALWAHGAAAQSVVLSPWPKAHFDDNNGNPCVGCKLFTYLAGTTTKQLTYTDSGGGTANVDPVILDARGEANVWLTAGLTYKYVLAPSTDSDPPTNAYWTVDDIPSTGFSVSVTTAGFDDRNPLYFPSYSQLGAVVTKLSQSGAVTDAPNFRDTLYAENSDSDTSVYTQSLGNLAGRFAAFGPNNGTWQTTYKNIVGLSAYGMAATSGTPTPSFAPGVSGVLGEAFQYGAGISSNEFAAHNAAAADGGIAQSLSITPGQFILDASFADADLSHPAWGVVISNVSSKIATGGLSMTSTGEQQFGVAMNGANVTTSAIVMPHSSVGVAGTIIDYGLANGNPAGGSYSAWDPASDGGLYFWVDGGVTVATIGASGLTVPTNVAVGGTFKVTQASPAAADVCIAGQIVADTGFLYTCASSGVWKRVAVTGGY